MQSKRLPIAVLGVAFVVSACGRTGSASDVPPPEVHTIDLAGELANYHGTVDLVTPKEAFAEVAMDDFFFTPTVIIGTPETEIRLTLRNTSRTKHNLTLEELDIDVDVPPGGSRDIRVDVPRLGGYMFFCKYHAVSGMRGWIGNPGEPTAELVGGDGG